jgi:hypothetical protein
MPSLPKVRCFTFQYVDGEEVKKMGAMKALFTEMQMDMLASAEVLATASNNADPDEMARAIYVSMKVLNPHLKTLLGE